MADIHICHETSLFFCILLGKASGHEERRSIQTRASLSTSPWLCGSEVMTSTSVRTLLELTDPEDTKQSVFWITTGARVPILSPQTLRRMVPSSAAPWTL